MKQLFALHRLFPVVCLLAVVAAPLAAEQPATEDDPPAPLEQMAKDLKGIGAHYQNSKLKVGRPMAGASRTGPEAEPATPAEACCSSNLAIIERKLRGMSRTLEQLYFYYKERRDNEAIGELQTIRDEMLVVSRGFAVFKKQETEAGAREALLGILRPYNRLRLAIERLQVCCAIDPRYWAAPPTPSAER